MRKGQLITDDSYMPDVEESENLCWMDYDHHLMSSEGFIPQPGAEWNAAIQEARRLYRQQRRDVDHPAWPILRRTWDRAEREVIQMFNANGEMLPPDQTSRDSLSHWVESDGKEGLVSDLTPLLQQCGAVVIRALLDGDEKLFSELAKMIAVAFKTRSKKTGKQSNRVRLDIIMLAYELWDHRGKNLTIDALWEACVRRGILEKGMTVAAWNKMIDRCHLSFLRTGTTSDKLPENWQDILAENETRHHSQNESASDHKRSGK